MPMHRIGNFVGAERLDALDDGCQQFVVAARRGKRLLRVFAQHAVESGGRHFAGPHVDRDADDLRVFPGKPQPLGRPAGAGHHVVEFFQQPGVDERADRLGDGGKRDAHVLRELAARRGPVLANGAQHQRFVDAAQKLRLNRRDVGHTAVLDQSADILFAGDRSGRSAHGIVLELVLIATPGPTFNLP